MDIGNKDKSFPLEVLSKDGIVLPAKVDVTARANVHDLLDFIQSGNDIKNVMDQIDQIVMRDARILCRSMDHLSIYKCGEQISRALAVDLENVFETQAFGGEIIKIQFVATLPPDIVKKMQAVPIEKYERKAERAEYKTMRIAAEDLQEATAKAYAPGGVLPSNPTQKRAVIAQLVSQKKVSSLDHYMDVVKQLRLVRDEHVTRIESVGDKGLTIINPKIGN